MSLALRVRGRVFLLVEPSGFSLILLRIYVHSNIKGCPLFWNDIYLSVSKTSRLVVCAGCFWSLLVPLHVISSVEFGAAFTSVASLLFSDADAGVMTVAGSVVF